MSIEGLRAPEPQNVSEEVRATIEVLDRLGLVQDYEKATETIGNDYATLYREHGGLGYGTAYVQLSRSAVSLPKLIDLGFVPGLPRRSRLGINALSVWVPHDSPHSYRDEDIGNLQLDEEGEWPIHARLAVNNHNYDENYVQSEPLLHFAGQPFNEEFAEDGEKTQLDSMAEAKEAYEAEHEGYSMTPLNTNAIVMIALMDIIRGYPPNLSTRIRPSPATMIDATLPVTFDRQMSRSGIGSVSIYHDAEDRYNVMNLGPSFGLASKTQGIGLSVGPKIQKP